jgi:hypothetical protein
MSFQPSTHGFKFRNSFAGYPLPRDVSIPNLPPPSGTFGLCGGMSAAAYDFYAANRPIPATKAVPTKGTPLYEYLYQRQLATFGSLQPAGGYIAKFINWMARPDDNTYGFDGTRKLTRDEYQAISRELSQGRPAVIGLVYVAAKDTAAVWKNHQVLAYSLRETRDHRKPEPIRSFTLGVYDPNYHEQDDITIRAEELVVGRTKTLWWSRDVYGFKCVQHVPGRMIDGVLRPDINVRGFFLMKHGRVTPPSQL